MLERMIVLHIPHALVLRNLKRQRRLTTPTGWVNDRDFRLYKTAPGNFRRFRPYIVLDGTVESSDAGVRIRYRMRPNWIAILFMAIFALALLYAAICAIDSVKSVPFLIAALIVNGILLLDVGSQIKTCNESFLRSLESPDEGQSGDPLAP